MGRHPPARSRYRHPHHSTPARSRPYQYHPALLPPGAKPPDRHDLTSGTARPFQPSALKVRGFPWRIGQGARHRRPGLSRDPCLVLGTGQGGDEVHAAGGPHRVGPLSALPARPVRGDRGDCARATLPVHARPSVMPRMDSPFNRISRDGVCRRQDMTRQYRHACASIGHPARFSRGLEPSPRQFDRPTVPAPTTGSMHFD